jgi:NAD(P)H-dependent FMN reductase
MYMEKAMERKNEVLVIMGSARAGRLNPIVARWIVALAQKQTDCVYEIVDLAEWHLPLDDEPAIPATGRYAEAHTRAWSQKIAGADAVIFVTPQYNWGYPAALKNAIDHLYLEWRAKPALIVTYGGHGGTKCAEQLKQVAAAVELRLVETTPGLVLPRAVIREGATLDPNQDFKDHVASIHSALSTLAEFLSETGER